MNNTGWIKTYRSLKDHELVTDQLAYTLFSVILMSVDRNTGSFKSGRLALAQLLKVHPSSLRNALKRLESKYEVISTFRTTTHTEITVLNWSKYQGDNDTEDNKRTAKGQRKDSPYIQEERIENIERDTPVSHPSKELHKTREYLTHIPEQELTELSTTYKASKLEVKNKAEDLHNWALSKGRIYKDYRAFLRNALAKDYGKKETDSFHGIPILRSSNYAKPN